MLQFPPFARASHGPARHQRRITGPRPAHPAANAGPHPATTRLYQPQPRPPGHAPPPARPATAHRPTPRRQRGFCTIRRTATACRRRVAPLMLQFPPLATPTTASTTNHGPPTPPLVATPSGPRGRQRRTTPSHNAPQPTATSPARPRPAAQPPITGPRPVACPPGHRSPAHAPPPNGGFCTTRRTATACRRRVAPLMLQFPPLTTPSTASPAASDGQPGHGLGPASRPVPLAHPSSRTHYSDKTKSDQFSSFKLPQTNSQRTRIHA